MLCLKFLTDALCQNIPISPYINAHIISPRTRKIRASTKQKERWKTNFFLVTSLTANLIILIFLTPIRQFSVFAGGGGFPEGAPKIKRCKKKKIFRL